MRSTVIARGPSDGSRIGSGLELNDESPGPSTGRCHSQRNNFRLRSCVIPLTHYDHGIFVSPRYGFGLRSQRRSPRLGHAAPCLLPLVTWGCLFWYSSPWPGITPVLSKRSRAHERKRFIAKDWRAIEDRCGQRIMGERRFPSPCYAAALDLFGKGKSCSNCCYRPPRWAKIRSRQLHPFSFAPDEFASGMHRS